MRNKIAVLALSAGLALLGLSNVQAQQTPALRNSGQPWYNCRTREVWSPAKTAWCQKVRNLGNTRYQLGEFGWLQLKNGTYENPAKYIAATLINQPGTIAFADLNKDKQEDAVALVSVNSGASGILVYLSAVEYVSNSSTTSVLLGDRVKVQSISVNGQIKVDLIKHRPNEPLCCPTQAVTQTYELQGNNLVLVNESIVKVSGQNQYSAISLNQIDRKLLTGNDPKQLALAAFGIKETEGNFQQTANMQKNFQSAIVTITQLGLTDDSVRSVRYRVEFEPLTTTPTQWWRMLWAGKQYKCQPGRGDQNWTTKLCS